MSEVHKNPQTNPVKENTKPSIKKKSGTAISNIYKINESKNPQIKQTQGNMEKLHKSQSPNNKILESRLGLKNKFAKFMGRNTRIQESRSFPRRLNLKAISNEKKHPNSGFFNTSNFVFPTHLDKEKAIGEKKFSEDSFRTRTHHTLTSFKKSAHLFKSQSSLSSLNSILLPSTTKNNQNYSKKASILDDFMLSVFGSNMNKNKSESNERIENTNQQEKFHAKSKSPTLSNKSKRKEKKKESKLSTKNSSLTKNKQNMNILNTSTYPFETTDNTISQLPPNYYQNLGQDTEDILKSKVKYNYLFNTYKNYKEFQKLDEIFNQSQDPVPEQPSENTGKKENSQNYEDGFFDYIFDNNKRKKYKDKLLQNNSKYKIIISKRKSKKSENPDEPSANPNNSEVETGRKKESEKKQETEEEESKTNKKELKTQQNKINGNNTRAQIHEILHAMRNHKYSEFNKFNKLKQWTDPMQVSQLNTDTNRSGILNIQKITLQSSNKNLNSQRNIHTPSRTNKIEHNHLPENLNIPDLKQNAANSFHSQSEGNKIQRKLKSVASLPRNNQNQINLIKQTSNSTNQSNQNIKATLPRDLLISKSRSNSQYPQLLPNFTPSNLTATEKMNDYHLMSINKSFSFADNAKITRKRNFFISEVNADNPDLNKRSQSISKFPSEARKVHKDFPKTKLTNDKIIEKPHTSSGFKISSQINPINNMDSKRGKVKKTNLSAISNMNYNITNNANNMNNSFNLFQQRELTPDIPIQDIEEFLQISSNHFPKKSGSLQRGSTAQRIIGRKRKSEIECVNTASHNSGRRNIKSQQNLSKKVAPPTDNFTLDSELRKPIQPIQISNTKDTSRSLLDGYTNQDEIQKSKFNSSKMRNYEKPSTDRPSTANASISPKGLSQLSKNQHISQSNYGKEFENASPLKGESFESKDNKQKGRAFPIRQLFRIREMDLNMNKQSLFQHFENLWNKCNSPSNYNDRINHRNNLHKMLKYKNPFNWTKEISSKGGKQDKHETHKALVSSKIQENLYSQLKKELDMSMSKSSKAHPSTHTLNLSTNTTTTSSSVKKKHPLNTLHEHSTTQIENTLHSQQLQTQHKESSNYLPIKAHSHHTNTQHTQHTQHTNTHPHTHANQHPQTNPYNPTHKHKHSNSYTHNAHKTPYTYKNYKYRYMNRPLTHLTYSQHPTATPHTQQMPQQQQIQSSNSVPHSNPQLANLLHATNITLQKRKANAQGIYNTQSAFNNSFNQQQQNYQQQHQQQIQINRLYGGVHVSAFSKQGKVGARIAGGLYPNHGRDMQRNQCAKTRFIKDPVNFTNFKCNITIPTLGKERRLSSKKGSVPKKNIRTPFNPEVIDTSVNNDDWSDLCGWNM